MPYSSDLCKQEIKDWFDSRSDITHITDVGCGSGTYPKLLGREKYHWTGIEVWEPYVDEFNLRDLYDRLVIGDFFDNYYKVPGGDTIIFGDVLEHMTAEDVVRAITIGDKYFQHVVISIPINYPQEATENPYEEHKSLWTMEEINAVVPESFKIRGINWNIALFIK